MEKLFFGKLPASADDNQFKNGYAIAYKSWFNGLKIGDYAFVGSSGKIALWKAEKEENYPENRIKISFEIIDEDIGFNTKKFRNLKGLIINPQLVFTQRQSKNKGFFELKLQEGYEVSNFLDKNYYGNDNNFRKIKIYKSQSSVKEDSEDVQLFLDNGELKLYESSFIAEQAYNDFFDYRKEANGAHPDKDKTFKIIAKAISENTEELSYKDLTIADLYDAFFCEYKVNYWLIAPGEDLDKSWGKSIKNGNISIGWGWTGDLNNFKNEQSFTTKFKETFDKEDNRSANDVWKFFDKIKIGDIIFAKKGMSKIWGMGIVTSAYYYDNSDEEYAHIHDVDWKNIKEFEYNHNIRETITQLKKTQGEEIMQAMNEQVYKSLIAKKDLLLNNKNIILHGAPGTGKTYTAKDIAAQLICGTTFDVINNDATLLKKFNEQTEFVQFHPSYDYSDFVEGLRPLEGDTKGDVGFERKDGVFKKFCENALKINKNLTDEETSLKDGTPFVFIIDEINRGEMSKIFGELFFSIDPDYRGIKGKVKTQYANMIKEQNKFDKIIQSEKSFGNFFVPENVYIIGTMNDIDRSVDSMDFAMRRRFTFIELKASENIAMLKDIYCKDNETITVNEIKAKMDCLNNEIYNENEHKGIPGLSSAYHIGGSYFLKLEKYSNQTKEQAFLSLWNNHLNPLLTDYLRGFPNSEQKLSMLKTKYLNAKFNTEDPGINE